MFLCCYISSSRIFMMTSPNGNIFRVTGHLCGEFIGHTAQRPLTRSFDVFFDLRLNKRFSKQWRGWWFETPSRPLWCHCNVMQFIYLLHFHFLLHWPWDNCIIALLSLVVHRSDPEIILGKGSANERRRYIVTSSLIGRAHAQNDHSHQQQTVTQFKREIDIFDNVK